ncbi:MAG: hypothetical protein AAF959_05290 [Cyanobacteria bacterium P01_D01_bin.56]
MQTTPKIKGVSLRQAEKAVKSFLKTLMDPSRYDQMLLSKLDELFPDTKDTRPLNEELGVFCNNSWEARCTPALAAKVKSSIDAVPVRSFEGYAMDIMMTTRSGMEPTAGWKVFECLISDSCEDKPPILLVSGMCFLPQSAYNDGGKDRIVFMLASEIGLERKRAKGFGSVSNSK